MPEEILEVKPGLPTCNHPTSLRNFSRQAQDYGSYLQSMFKLVPWFVVTDPTWRNGYIDAIDFDIWPVNNTYIYIYTYIYICVCVIGIYWQPPYVTPFISYIILFVVGVPSDVPRRVTSPLTWEVRKSKHLQVSITCHLFHSLIQLFSSSQFSLPVRSPSKT
jgi:hypothetical protein